jgi:sugar phosphate isomerase/epimerase
MKLRILALVSLLAGSGPVLGSDFPQWQHLSSKTGDLPVPGESTQQTGALIVDADQDGRNDFVLSFRQKAPALVWYRRTDQGWDRYVIEKDFLTVEAGGAVYDIDGDGHPDLVFGGDWQSKEVWWWQNPYPNYDPQVPWKRHLIKKDGATQHHDQAFGDFLGKGKAQLVFWNQGASTIFLAEIPDDPRHMEGWPMTAIFFGEAGEGGRTALKYPEGIFAYDVDGDGKVDLLAGNYWFKHLGGTKFQAIKIAEIGGRIAAGHFKSGKTAQIVIAPGDGVGPLRWYECTGDPLKSSDWAGHNLLTRDVVHGHSLQLADLNGDGHLDIFCAEMAKWHEQQPNPDNPNATAWIFYGDGQGGFQTTELVTGNGFHEAQVGDLDGDGDLDILNKPYNWEVPRVDVWLNNGTRSGAKGIGTSSSFHGPMGLQLYSLRDILGKDVPLGLQFARNFGFVEVELAGTYNVPPAQFRAFLERNRLKPISGIWDYNLFANDLSTVVREAKALGVSYAGCAWIPHQGDLDEASCRTAAALFNRVGEALSKDGLKFFYHNHGYEFQPYKDGTLFDLLMAETKPEFVAYEMDIFWTVFPAQDPVALLKKYAGRWKLMHVKDIKKGLKTGSLSGGTDVTNDVAIGTGQIDIPQVLRAAQEAGVKHYFIEDESPISTQQIPQSLRYLGAMAW